MSGHGRLQAFLVKGRALPISHNQYRCCWWPGDVSLSLEISCLNLYIWNLTDASATLLLQRLSNFRAIRQLQTIFSRRIWGFVRLGSGLYNLFMSFCLPISLSTSHPNTTKSLWSIAELGHIVYEDFPEFSSTLIKSVYGEIELMELSRNTYSRWLPGAIL